MSRLRSGDRHRGRRWRRCRRCGIICGCDSCSGLLPTPEDPDQVSRGSRHRCAIPPPSMRIDCRRYRQDDVIAFRPQGIGVLLVQIKHNPRDERAQAVLGSAHNEYAVGIDTNLSRLISASGVGKIEQDAVRVNRGLNRGLDRGTERDLHAEISAVARHSYVLDNGRRWALRGGTRQQEHQGANMFLNCLHFLLTLAGAPPAAWILHPAVA